MSLYYEHLLNPEHQIESLWKHIALPDHWSVHKESVVHDDDDTDLEAIYNAEMACVFAPNNDTVIGCSFDPCNMDDLPAAGLLERYAANNSGQTAVVNFWLPREGVFGVACVGWETGT